MKKNTRPTIALLGLTSILPLFLIGIRWASYFGDTSKLGIALADIMAHVMHGLFLIACVWVALGRLQPRHMGYGFSFLTFYLSGRAEHRLFQRVFPAGF